MADTAKINLEENSKYRVAYDLMQQIAFCESDRAGKHEREYYLRLYRQCYESVYGYRNIEEVVNAKPSAGMGMRS